MRIKTIIAAVALVAAQSAVAAVVTVDMTRHGIRPGASDLSRRIERVLSSLTTHPDSDEVVLSFAPGRYDFYPDKAIKRELFISNHDQTNPRTVGLMLDSLHNVTIDGAGSDFVFHGRMLPVAAVGCTGLTLTDFTIDFENPQIAQVRITDFARHNLHPRTLGEMASGLRRFLRDLRRGLDSPTRKRYSV